MWRVRERLAIEKEHHGTRSRRNMAGDLRHAADHGGLGGPHPFYALVANSFTNVERYLTDPTPENLSKLSIGLAGDLAQRARILRGLGRIDSAADLLASHHPPCCAYGPPSRPSTTREQHPIPRPRAHGQRPGVDTRYARPVFQRVLAKHMSRKRSRTLPETRPQRSHRARLATGRIIELTDPDPIRALAYSLW